MHLTTTQHASLKFWKPVAPDVAYYRHGIVNVCCVDQSDSEDWVLVDTGMPFSSAAIRRAVEARYGRDARPSAIILTHGHFDHVGGLPGLSEEWDVPVYAHPLEAPYLNGSSSYPPPDPTVGGGLMSRLSFLYPKGPIDLGDRLQPLPSDGTVPFLPDWKWVHTPGHTPGHIALFRSSDRALIAGDAITTTKQESAFSALLPRSPQVRRPPAYFTTDWQMAKESIIHLMRLKPQVAITGHGLPISGRRLAEGLEQLVRNWSSIGRPSHGRYVQEPALADERGVISQPVHSLSWKHWTTALGIGALVGVLLRRSRSR